MTQQQGGQHYRFTPEHMQQMIDHGILKPEEEPVLIEGQVYVVQRDASPAEASMPPVRQLVSVRLYARHPGTPGSRHQLVLGSNVLFPDLMVALERWADHEKVRNALLTNLETLRNERGKAEIHDENLITATRHEYQWQLDRSVEITDEIKALVLDALQRAVQGLQDGQLRVSSAGRDPETRLADGMLDFEIVSVVESAE